MVSRVVEVYGGVSGAIGCLVSRVAVVAGLLGMAVVAGMVGVVEWSDG